MDQNQIIKKSKFLSLVLRHKPRAANVKLDKSGWVNVNDLLKGCEEVGQPITMAELLEVVATNNKKRFEFNENHTMIRASQGHSVNIDLGYKATTPPEILYHGTAYKNKDSIQKMGLEKRRRHHVHLSADPETANIVGKRHGKPIILVIDTRAMMADGYKFYQSTNGVWLVESVPPKYFTIL